jgi:hypothetical protein
MARKTPLSKYEKPLKKEIFTDSNISEEKSSKIVEFYRDSFSMRQMPATKHFIENLALEWVTFVRNDKTVIRLTQFLETKGIPRNTFDRWVIKFPILQEAKEVVWDLMASHRELGVCVRDDKGNTKLTREALIMMHHYDDIWKKGEEWKGSITQKTDALSNIKVVMEAYPSSSLCPDKKKEIDE